jgi:hypothetical protein
MEWFEVISKVLQDLPESVYSMHETGVVRSQAKYS